MSSLTRSWECSFLGCTKKFSRKEHLNRHNLTHNPEHQYKCHICGRRYARSDVFKRHVKQHNPEASVPSDTRRICLPCGERSTQCDGNSPCGACISSWSECRWVDSNTSRGTDTEQVAAVPPATQNQTAWFPPSPGVWASPSFPVTPPYSSMPNNLTSGTPMQGMEPTGGVATEPNPITPSVESVPSDNTNLLSEFTSPYRLHQQKPGTSDSANNSELDNVFDRNSPTAKRLIDVFFAEIYPRWPILHAPTFEVDKVPTVLLASMAMLASWLERGTEHQKLAPLVFEEVNRIRIDFNPSLYLLQAVLLYLVYGMSNLTVDGMVPRVLNLAAFLISTCRYLGIFNGQYSCHEMDDHECDSPFVTWRCQEQLNRLAFATLRVDVYLSVLLDHPPSIRYQELCIPLPKSRQLWNASSDEERRVLQWNEPAGREKALFSFFMRDALNPDRVGTLPYCLTDVDYHLSTCAAQGLIWEAARETNSSMSDELVQEVDPGTFVKLARTHLWLWREKRVGNCEVRQGFFSSTLSDAEHTLAPLTFTLMYMAPLKLFAPLNALRLKGHYYKCRPGSTIPTRKPQAHLCSWVTSGCPRAALWYAAQICRIFVLESRSNNRARLRLNPLLIPGVLMSAIIACSYARLTKSCAYCSRLQSQCNQNSTPGSIPPPPSTPMAPGDMADEEAINLFEAGDHDPELEKWRKEGVGVPYWGEQNERIPVCACRLQDIAAWFREALAEDKAAEVEFVIFLAELSRDS
ncbi:hypothetical protein M426DRAFT_255654 [Hypoxylon sp. CI-4A]|nr:hypothetical protein M426DRAFT_255654 [Hypoxylon sp. CI-4A]